MWNSSQRVLSKSQLLWCASKSGPSFQMLRSSSSLASKPSTDDYFTRNATLNRPVSPFINYKIQMTSALSISHRLTGLALAVLVYGGGIAAFATSSTNFAQILSAVQSTVPYSLIFAFKVLTGTSLAYHAFNGVRHLAWDVGYGFSLKQLYISGYAVLGLTLLAAIAIIISK